MSNLSLKWGPALLRLELDKWMWLDKDYIAIKTLCRIHDPALLSTPVARYVLKDTSRGDWHRRGISLTRQTVAADGRFLDLRLRID